MRQYDAKRDMGKALTADEMGIRMTGKLPEGKIPVVIDNVVATGNTAEACVKAIGTGLVVSLAGAVSGYGHVASLKSAAPVAYDRKGEVIPLSRRFDYTGSTYLSAIRKDMGYYTESEDSQEPVKIHGLEAYSEQEIKKYVREHFETMLEGTDIDARIVDMKVIGSRVEGNHDDNSDLDVLLEFEGDVSEDSLFNILNDNEDQLYIEGIPVDINPITESKSGTIQEFLERNRDYQKENDKQKDDINIENKAMPKAEVNKERKDLFQMAIGTSFDISSEYHVKLNEKLQTVTPKELQEIAVSMRGESRDVNMSDGVVTWYDVNDKADADKFIDHVTKLEDQRANELSIDSDSGMAKEDIPAYGNLESAQRAIINVAEETDMTYSAIRLPEVVSLQDYDDGVDMRTVPLSYYTVSKSGITLYEHATDAYDNENGIPISELPDQDARKVIDFAQEFFGKQDESFLRHIDTPNVPEYALPSILYGDNSGLYEEDEKNVQQFFDRYKANFSPLYVVRDEEASFSTHPAFGLASDCVHVDVFESTTLRQLRARKAVEDGIDGMNQQKNEYSKYVIPSGITVKDAKLTRIEPKDGEKIAAWKLSAEINGKRSEAMMWGKDVKAFFAKDADGHRNKSVTLDMLVAKYFGKQFADSMDIGSTQEADQLKREQAAKERESAKDAERSEKIPVEDTQAFLIRHGLFSASIAIDGIWMNKDRKPAPVLSNNSDQAISPFNQLMIGLHSDLNGYKTTEYTTFIDANKAGYQIKGGEKALPFNWYNWNKFVNKYNSNDVISREAYEVLPAEERELYRVLRTKEDKRIFNVEQTTMPYQDAKQYKEILQRSQDESENHTDLSVSDKSLVDLEKHLAYLNEHYSDRVVLLRNNDDHYTAYGEDAQKVSAITGLPVTPCIGVSKKPMQQVSFRISALDTYLPKIIKAGEMVAICDGISDFRHLKNTTTADTIYEKLNDLCRSLSAQDSKVKYSPTVATGYDCSSGQLKINNSQSAPIGQSISMAIERLNDAYRAAVAYTGCEERLARNANSNQLPEDKDKYNRLITELVAGVMMAREGLPAKISQENRLLLAYWQRELKENPAMVNNIERDVNDAVMVLDKIRKGEEVNYAALRSDKPIASTRESSYSIINTLNTLPNEDEKVAVIIKDDDRKAAAVILPAGASLEKNNEIPGMNKNRYVIALHKEGYQDVNFYNAGGDLGLKQPNEFFADKVVETARLKQYELIVKDRYDLSDEIDRTKDIIIEKMTMTKDDHNKPLLYVKPEGKPYFSVYPEASDVTRFFESVRKPRVGPEICEYRRKASRPQITRHYAGHQRYRYITHQFRESDKGQIQ